MQKQKGPSNRSKRANKDHEANINTSLQFRLIEKIMLSASLQRFSKSIPSQSEILVYFSLLGTIAKPFLLTDWSWCFKNKKNVQALLFFICSAIILRKCNKCFVRNSNKPVSFLSGNTFNKNNLDKKVLRSHQLPVIVLNR